MGRTGNRLGVGSWEHVGETMRRKIDCCDH